MFSTLRTRFGIPGVISVIALVFAMFGGAYAASNSSDGGKATASAAKGKPGPRGKTGKTGPAGPAGPAGPQGPAGPAGAKGDTGAAGSNGSNGAPGADGKSVTGEPIAAGGACGAGVTGVKYTLNAVSTPVCNGKNGKDGETGFTETLPPGKTETGVWGGNGSGGLVAIPISFTLPLEAAPTFVYVEPGETKVAEGCPGIDADGLPLADPGTLCVYAGFIFQATYLNNLTIKEELGTKSTPPGVGPAGTVINFACGVEELPVCRTNGAWAVTAEE